MKAFLTTISSFFICWTFAQAPINDDCAGIIDLGEVPYCSAPAQYTNVDATPSDIDPMNNIPLCFNNGVERDVWFQFTLPADGSIVDIVINVYGNVDGNGTMQMPQVAIYRGDCIYTGLAELDCAAAPLNVNQVQLEQFGLTPGIPYFLRINDYSATAAANAGTFKLCIEKYVPDINMGETASTGHCTGTLWDSGGPDNDYTDGENLTFTICPQEFHQCIVLNLVNFSTEQGFDYISFYQGADLSGLQLTQISGSGQNFEVQIPGACATIQFQSDGSGTDQGFQMTWTCSPNACTTEPPTTCADPAVIAGLPFAQDDLSNCFSGNTISDGPCDDDQFMAGNDYIFSYTSPGDECIKISTSGTIEGAGVGVYDLCPSMAGASCIASAGGGFFSVDPVVGAAFLENPGTYYLVFGAGQDCSPFNITVDTVTCPVVLPPTGCDNPLNLANCSNDAPEIIAVSPGAGDPDFIQNGVNQGCFVLPQQNYAFFYFTAAVDGKFGFIVEAADANEASDIDLNVWGPVNDPEDICDYISNNQPIRSTWTGGDMSTGLTDVNPELGTPVNDDFDCGSPATPGAGGDRYVRRIDVLQGETYVIMLDDYGNTIVNGGISIDFGGTTDGMFNTPGNPITVSPDTAVCAGQPVQLNATGGVAYFWSPSEELSCSQCENPLATATETTTYQVQIISACNSVTRTVDVKVAYLDLGANATVCSGASFTLNPNPYPASYNWIGNAGLSCYDCPSPVVSGLTPGIYTYIAILTTPQCVKTDTIKITVLNGQQPQYSIADDIISCTGEAVNLGGPTVPGSFYTWTSVPAGFSSSIADPGVTPTQTTMYYLETANGSCPVTAIDSVLVTVFQSPVLQVQGDTAICNGQSVLLGTTVPEAGITYSWTPDNGSLDSIGLANPLAMPLTTTVYSLTAFNPGCVENRTVTVAVVNLDLELSVGDTVLLCKGTPLPIEATITPPNTVVNWSPLVDIQIGPNGQSVLSTPDETILYTVSASLPGCSRVLSVYVAVDSLPFNMAIDPSDTTVCIGSQVLLKSPVYEPADFPNIRFQWSPSNGMLTPDSLFNLVVTPTDTITYYRVATSGGCTQTDSALVNVIVPPQMLITPPASAICAGGSVQLVLSNFAGVEDITWTPDNNSLTCTDCTDPVATPTATTTYTASGTFQGCPTAASAAVVLNGAPLYDFPDDVQLCAGESLVLNLINDPTATYTWTSTDPNFGTVTTAQPSVTPTQTATYFMQASNGCSAQDQVTVTVTSATLEADGDTTICSGNSAQLTASTSLPGPLTWSSGQTGNNIQVAPTQTTVYTVTFSFGDNCQITDEVTVGVQGQAAGIVPPTDLEICPGESVTLNSSTTPGATYVWTSTPPGFNSTDPQPTVTPSPGNTTYNITTTLGICTHTESVSIIAYTATLSLTPDTIICLGERATIKANGSLTGDYTWSNGQDGPSIEVFPNAPTTYGLVYTYGQDCILEGEIFVDVSPNFTVNIVSNPNKDTIGLGESIDLTATVVPNVAGYQFTWEETTQSASMGTTATITVSPTTNDTGAVNFVYVVTATSAAGCIQTDTFVLVVLPPSVTFPNAFTPNGDGINDVFGMVILRGIATIDRMDIFNRWGQKVFTSTESAATWDAKVDGKDAPAEVYVYRVRWRKGDGSLQVAEGHVTLLR